MATLSTTTPPETAAAHGRGRGRTSRPGGPGDRVVLWSIAAVVALPFLVAAWKIIAEGPLTTIGDTAGIELRTRDVGHHPVLTGLWSRGDWNHPGPILFYLLSIPYRLTGSHSVGLQLGALIINGVAAIGIVAVARRHGGTPLLLLTAVGTGLLVWGLGPLFVRDPWNPYIPVLPFAFLAMLCWAMSCGDRWALPVASGVASFCVQVHVSYAVLAGPLVLLGVAWLAAPVIRAGRQGRRRWRDALGPLRAPIIATAVVLAVLWLPPLVQQLQRGSRGNLVRIAAYFAFSSEEHASLTEGYHIVAAQFGLPPTWLDRERDLGFLSLEPEVLRSSPAPVLLIPLALVALLLWRRPSPPTAKLLTTVGVAAVLGWLSVARTFRPVYDYRLRWSSVIGMLALAVIAWTLWQLVVSRWPRAGTRLLAGAAVAGLVVVTVTNAVDAAKTGGADDQASGAVVVDELMPSLIAALPPGHGVVVLRSLDNTGIVFQGVFLGLERRGVDVRTDEPILGNDVGHRGWDGEPARAVLTVAIGRPLGELIDARDQRLVAYTGGLPPGEFARRQRRIAELIEAHDAGEINNFELLDELSRLSRGVGIAGGVFLDDPPDDS